MARAPLAPATHSVVDGHVIAVYARSVDVAPNGLLTDHDEAPPVGSLDARRLPILSTPMQIEVDGQEMATGVPRGSTFLTVHELARVGSVEVSTSPSFATAAQNDNVGQEMPVRPPGRTPIGGTGSICAYGVHCMALA
ncbi:MAG TPA: hypothetical protein VIJ33_08320, partial [Solirubrobacteraceae bacterium]